MRWAVYAAMAGAALGVLVGAGWILDWLVAGGSGAPGLAVLLIVAGAGCAGIVGVALLVARGVEAVERIERGLAPTQPAGVRGLTAAEVAAAERVRRGYDIRRHSHPVRPHSTRAPRHAAPA